MSGNYSFFRLPVELCCVVLREWLLFKFVVHLDSAVCNAEERSVLWNTIFASSQCIVAQKTHVYHHKEIIDWLRRRKLRVNGVIFSGKMDNGVRKYLQTFGETIRAIDFNICEVSAYLPLVSQYCPNAVCFHFAENNDVSFEEIIEYFHSNLVALDMSEVSLDDDDLKELVKRCPNITHLTLPTYSDFSEECGEVIGSNLKHLKHLGVSNTHVSDELLIAIADHCSNTLEEIHMEYCGDVVGAGFTAILQKCTKLRSAHITYQDDNFVDFDFSLLSNLTELHIINQNITQTYMSAVAKNGKKLERLLIDWRDSPSYARNSTLFHLKELSAESTPNLKVLHPFGIAETEIDYFHSMRPEVTIDESDEVYWRRFFDMAF